MTRHPRPDREGSRWTPTLPRRHNKRSLVLLILGAIWVAIGINVHIEPNPPGWENIWLFSAPPPSLRAGAWVLSGLIAVTVALRPRRIADDWPGFLALYLMPAERVLGFFLGWLDYLFDSYGGVGYSRGLLSGLVYLVIVLLIMVIADWADPPREHGGDL